MEAGKYRAAAITAELCESESSGKPYVLVTFQTTTGETVPWYGSLSETRLQSGKSAGKTVAELTIQALTRLGWKGDFSDLSSAIGKEVEVVVAVEADNNGNAQPKVKFINGSGAGKPVDKSGAAALTAKFKGAVIAAKVKEGAAENSPSAGQKPASASGSAPDPF